MCGGVPALIIEAFELLKSKGISEEIAVQECLFELSYILEVVKEKGIAGMYQAISPVAASGGYKVFGDIDNGGSLKDVFKKSFSDIDNRKFINYFNKTKREDVLKYIKKKAHNFDLALKEATK
jgi:ketol-acid reductoisomerase